MNSQNLKRVSKPVKIHYRMYKSGRHWLFASMTVVTVGGSLLWGNQAHAATTAPTDDESTDQTTVSGTASASSTVTLHESTSTTSQVSSSSAVSGDRQSSTSAMSQDSQASQVSQVTNDSSSASQPAISEGQSAQSSAQTTSQASQTSQATSASSSVGQSATSVGQPSPAATNSIGGATSQSKSATPSEASVAGNQRITIQHVVNLVNEQADSGTLMANLMTSGVNAANKIVATRASLLKDATPDSTFTWAIDDTGTTLTLNGGTPTESLYTMLTDAQREKIKHIVVANPVTIIGDVGKNFFYGFFNDETITGLEKINVDQATDLTSMFNRLGSNSSRPIAFGGLANWNVSKVTTFKSMFYNAQITSVDVENWHVGQVTDMSHMFEGTSQLSSLDLSGWRVTGKLSDMTNFAYQSNISSLDLRAWQVVPGLKAASAINMANLTEVGLNASFQRFYEDSFLGFRNSPIYPYDNQWIDEATQKRYTAEELETLYDSGKGTTSLYRFNTVTIKNLTTKSVTIQQNMTVDPSAFVDSFVDTDGRIWHGGNGGAIAPDLKFASPVDTNQVGDYQLEIVYTNDQGQSIPNSATLHVIPSRVTYTMQDQIAIIDENPADAGNTDEQMNNRLGLIVTKLDQLAVADDDGQKLTWRTEKLMPTEDSDAAVNAILMLQPGTYSLRFTYTDPIDNIPVESPVVTFTLIESKATLTLNSVTIIRPDKSITAADLFQTALDGYGDSLIDADGQLSSAVTLDLGGLDLSKPTPGTYQITVTYTDEANNVVTATQAVTVADTKESLELNNHDQPVSLIAGPCPYFDPANLVDSATDGFGNPINTSQLQYDYYDLNHQPVTLDLKNPGQYQLKISYQDSAGNIISKTVPVNLNATKANVKLTTKSEGIVINDTDFDPTSLIETAVDENGDPLIPTVVSTFARKARLGGNQLLITNHVDVTKAGTYTVDFSYTDVAGNAFTPSANVTVYVPATFAIQPTQTITQGEVFDPRSLFVSGTGVNGANLTAADLTYDLSGVDFTKVGVYQLPVSYKDQYGKLTKINSELTIKAQPVVGQAKITLNSVAPIVAAANQTFDPTQVVNTITTVAGEKVAVTDPDVKITSNVDPTKPGTYQVRVSYAGVSATVTISVIAVTNPGDGGNSGTTTPTKPDDGHHGGTPTPTNPDDNGGTTTLTTPDTGNGNNATVSDNNGGTTMPTVNKPVTSVKTPATANQSKPVIAKKQVTNNPVTNIQSVKASLVATDAHVKTGTWQASPAGVMLAKSEKTTVVSKKVSLKSATPQQTTNRQPVSGELPQTNDRLSVVGIVGAALVGLLGLFGLASHRKF